MNPYGDYIKPLMDKTLALALMILLLPVGLLVGVVLCVWHAGSPFFVQSRPGKNGKVFRLIKFRTMIECRDSSGTLLPDHHRITTVGHWLRRASLDEIPQLINVIKGEMSLVGPRPLLVEYLPLYNQNQRRRHDVLPGITGWAQVNGRNALDWEERFEYDLWYVDHVSFVLDLKILLLTIRKVIIREGVAADRFVAVEKFKGTV